LLIVRSNAFEDVLSITAKLRRDLSNHKNIHIREGSQSTYSNATLSMQPLPTTYPRRRPTW
jgi:hypothetical protein